jgi:hypothetical protein
MSHLEDLENPKLYKKSISKPFSYFKLTNDEEPLGLPVMNFGDEEKKPSKPKQQNASNSGEAPLEIPKVFGETSESKTIRNVPQKKKHLELEAPLETPKVFA